MPNLGLESKSSFWDKLSQITNLPVSLPQMDASSTDQTLTSVDVPNLENVAVQEDMTPELKNKNVLVRTIQAIFLNFIVFLVLPRSMFQSSIKVPPVQDLR